MRRKARAFLLIAVLMLSTVCVRCDGTGKSNEIKTSDILISREQAIQVVEKISNSSEVEDIAAYPEMDREIDGVLYYFIRVIYENNMSAAYFVEATEGKVFVAVRGELDTENPLATASIDSAASEASGEQTLEASKTVIITGLEESVVGELSEAIGMIEEQIKERFGEDYKNFSVSYDGYMKAFYYMEEGFIIAFGNDGKAKYVYCSDKIDINGAKAGMNFAEIQKLLGNSPIYQTWGETPQNMVYEISYSLGTVRLIFFSRQKDGSHSMLRIG